MVGRSKRLLEVFKSIQMLARTNVTVLILGETGTGKDLAAQAIHGLSARGKKSMVTVNCPALPENILESELFGYRRGAFTDANDDRRGLFDQAHGGTIFLDEIGDLSPAVQTKLLRVLEDKKIKPLGVSTSHEVDVRIIAATNQNLQSKMEAKQFREDLFYRLNVATLTMPSLREIRDDIPLLIDHFLEQAASEQNMSKKKLAPEVMNHLRARDWPGNIRELENTIRGWNAVIPDETITGRHLSGEAERGNPKPEDIDLNRSYRELKAEALQAFTLNYLSRLLEHTQGNITLSAQISGIKRQSLQKIIKRYGVAADIYRN
jgi:transcriptional regulator with PAS, ATPase and Fis domain